MLCLCIFQQPDNSDLFQGCGLASPGGSGLMDGVTMWGLPQVGG